MRRTTVVLPDPDPPATPITRRLCWPGPSAEAGAPFVVPSAVSATLAPYHDAGGTSHVATFHPELPPDAARRHRDRTRRVAGTRDPGSRRRTRHRAAPRGRARYG